MICPVCGKEIPDYTIFCAQCGRRVDRPVGTPAVPQPVPVQQYAPPVKPRDTEQTQAFTPVQDTQVPQRHEVPVQQHTPYVRQEQTPPVQKYEAQSTHQEYGDNYDVPARNPVSPEKMTKLFAIGAALLQLLSIIIMLAVPAFKSTDNMFGDVDLSFIDTFILGIFDDSAMLGCVLGIVGLLFAVVSFIVMLVGALGSRGVRSGTAYATAGMSLAFVLCQVIAVFAILGDGMTFSVGGWIAVALSAASAALAIFAGVKSKDADASGIPGTYY